MTEWGLSASLIMPIDSHSFYIPHNTTTCTSHSLNITTRETKRYFI